MSERVRVCSVTGPDGSSCPHLCPCPLHPPREQRSSWSPDRDRAAQHRFRRAVLARDRFTCQRAGCGLRDPTGRRLVAHHVRPGYEPGDGQTLCRSCHRDVDTHAR